MSRRFCCALALLAACGDLESARGRDRAPELVLVSRRAAPTLRLTTEHYRVTASGAGGDGDWSYGNGFLTGYEFGPEGFVVLDEVRVRFFRRGHEVAVIGRKGSGPGEYRNLAATCGLASDTLLVFDVSLQRLSVVASDGSAFRQLSFPPAGALPAQGCLLDGSFLLYPSRRERGAVIRVHPTGGALDTVAVAELSTLGRRVSIVASDRYILIANAEDPTIQRFHLDSGQVMSWHLPDQRRRMTIEEARVLFPFQPAVGTKAAPDSRERHERSWPLFEKALSDGAGGLWLQDAVRDGQDEETWAWIDVRGHVRGTMRIPHAPDDFLASAVQFLPGAVWVLKRGRDGGAAFVKYAIEPGK